MSVEASYLPVAIDFDGDKSTAKWLSVGGNDLSEPFLFQTLERLMAKGAARKVTPLKNLLNYIDEEPELNLVFICHVSRCGSTALANAAKTIDGAFVVSEPGIVLQATATAPEFLPTEFETTHSARVALLRAVIHAFAATASGCRYLVVKFASLATLHVALIRECFPKAPIIFVYRDPVEVIASNINRPSSVLALRKDVALASSLLDIPPEKLRRLSEPAFYACVYSAYCKAVQRLQRLTIVNYADISESFVKRLFHEAGIAQRDINRDAIRRSLEHHAKDSQRRTTFSAAADRQRLAEISKGFNIAEISIAQQAYSAISDFRGAVRPGWPA